MISHDLKNQLAIIRGFAEILLVEADDEDPRRADFEQIHAAASSALSILDRAGTLTSLSRSSPQSDGGRLADAEPAASPPVPVAATVLVVEDSHGVRELTRKFLARAGFTVLVAASPAEALSIFDRHAAIDVLLTDVVMPGGGGQALAMDLVERRPGLRVIYMSGYRDDELFRTGSLAPNTGFLHKPFTSEALHRVVLAALAA